MRIWEMKDSKDYEYQLVKYNCGHYYLSVFKKGLKIGKTKRVNSSNIESVIENKKIINIIDSY